MLKWFLIAAMAASTILQAQIEVLAFAGSTRADSVNKKLVNEAAKIAEECGGKVTVIDLKDYPIPFYDADLEADEGMPANAKTIRQLMISSQVILIASPEYNHSIPAVLKNMLDWVSRSEKAERSKEAYLDKTFVLMSASPSKGGGAKGLIHLKDIVEDQRAIVYTKQFSLPNAYSAFDSEGSLKDSVKLEELRVVVQSAMNSIKVPRE